MPGVVILVAVLWLAACGSPQPPIAFETSPPKPTETLMRTEPPAATQTPAPTAPPAPFKGDAFSAPNCEYGGLMKSIEALDRYTVRFTLCKPDPAFLSRIAYQAFAIQSKEWLDQNGGGGQGSKLLEMPVGTGPYMLQEWKKGESLVFTANPNYRGAAKARTPSLVFKWDNNPAQRLVELQAGMVDAIDAPGPNDFAAIQADKSLKLAPRPALNIMYVGMNNTYAPFDNEKVRQATALGIDRQRLVDKFYLPGSEVATHFTPCAIPNGCTGDDWYQYDPEKARALLAEAGFPDGFKTEIAYRDVVRDYLPLPGLVAQDLQAQLKKNLNIDASLNPVDSDAFQQLASSGKLPGLFLLGWGADYPDVTNFLDYHFGASADQAFGKKYADLTAVLQLAAALNGDEARMPFYEQANNLVKQHVPVVPVAHSGSATAWKASTDGAHSSPLGAEQLALASIPGKDTFIWMQSAEPLSLYCADETDGESLRACGQVAEPLYQFEPGGASARPNLARACEPNADLSEWTCRLQEGVKFSDGTDLDANDVVETYVVQWDAASPLHKGNTGAFDYWASLWGAFLNAPPK